MRVGDKYVIHRRCWWVGDGNSITGYFHVFESGTEVTILELRGESGVTITNNIKILKKTLLKYARPHEATLVKKILENYQV